MFLKKPEWDTPQQKRYENYCDFYNFLSVIKKEKYLENEKNEFKKLCNILLENEIIKNKIVIYEKDKFFEIKFNEYLYFTGDSSLIYMNKEITHYHFYLEEDFVNFILDVANGKKIFIENKCWFSPKRLLRIFIQPWNLRMISKDKFNFNKNKYIKKNWYRIYTGNEIIKRDWLEKKIK